MNLSSFQCAQSSTICFRSRLAFHLTPSSPFSCSFSDFLLSSIPIYSTAPTHTSTHSVFTESVSGAIFGCSTGKKGIRHSVTPTVLLTVIGMGAQVGSRSFSVVQTMNPELCCVTFTVRNLIKMTVGTSLPSVLSLCCIGWNIMYLWFVSINDEEAPALTHQYFAGVLPLQSETVMRTGTDWHTKPTASLLSLQEISVQLKNCHRQFFKLIGKVDAPHAICSFYVFLDSCMERWRTAYHITDGPHQTRRSTQPLLGSHIYHFATTDLTTMSVQYSTHP